MRARQSVSEPMIVRQVFPGWSIAVPAAFREAFVDEEDAEAYWHGYDDHRSISLTSYLIVDEFRGPVSGEELTRALAPPKGAHAAGDARHGRSGACGHHHIR